MQPFARRKSVREPYTFPVDPYVQQAVAGTNGRAYVRLVNRLPRYPIPTFPVNGTAHQELMLDLGCSWGRWMMAAAERGYRPIGIDQNLEALQAARRVLRAHGLRPHVVLGDLRELPFKNNAFALVFSYSVIQHMRRQYAEKAVQESHRILLPGGTALHQFPIRSGFRNFLRSMFADRTGEDDPQSDCVRYYSIPELGGMFGNIFGAFHYKADAYFSLGAQKADLDMLPRGARIVVISSEILRRVAGFLPFLATLADSIFAYARKTDRTGAAGKPPR